MTCFRKWRFFWWKQKPRLSSRWRAVLRKALKCALEASNDRYLSSMCQLWTLFCAHCLACTSALKYFAGPSALLVPAYCVCWYRLTAFRNHWVIALSHFLHNHCTLRWSNAPESQMIWKRGCCRMNNVATSQQFFNKTEIGINLKKLNRRPQRCRWKSLLRFHHLE